MASKLVSDIITDYSPAVALSNLTPSDPYYIPAPAIALEYFEMYFDYGLTLYLYVNERAFRSEFSISIGQWST